MPIKSNTWPTHFAMYTRCHQKWFLAGSHPRTEIGFWLGSGHRSKWSFSSWKIRGRPTWDNRPKHEQNPYRSSFVELFSRLGCWYQSEKVVLDLFFLLLQFTHDFPRFISCCITMLHIQHHLILFQLNCLLWAIDKTKWCHDKWPQINRVNHHLPSIHHKSSKIETLNSDQLCLLVNRLWSATDRLFGSPFRIDIC